MFAAAVLGTNDRTTTTAEPSHLIEQTRPLDGTFPLEETRR